VVHIWDDQEVGVVHAIISPKNQPQFSQTIIRQYWLGKQSPNKLSVRPEMLSKKLLWIFYLIFIFLIFNFFVYPGLIHCLPPPPSTDGKCWTSEKYYKNKVTLHSRLLRQAGQTKYFIYWN